MKNTLQTFRFLSSFIVCFYPFMILLEQEIKSYIPIFAGAIMGVTYLALMKTTLITTMLRLLASIVLIAAGMSVIYGVTMSIQTLPELPSPAVAISLLAGGCVLFFVFKVPSWVWE